MARLVTMLISKLNLCKAEIKKWPARRDLNPRSSESESAALSSCATGGYKKFSILKWERTYIRSQM